MKKKELIEFFDKFGIVYENDMKYQDMLKLYKKVNEQFDENEKITEPKVVEEIKEEYVKQLSQEEQFKIYREKLMVKIVELMKQLRGKSNCTQKQLGDMFRLYNQYYKRNDSPTCSPCVSRVYQQLKKISKKYM